MLTVDACIQGLTPLIVNRFHEGSQHDVETGTSSRKERPGAEQDAEMRLYQNGHGTFYPSENIRQSMIGAASRHKIGRRAATTDIAASVYLSPFDLPLASKWHVDSRAVVIKATGGRVVRHRPMFDDWSLSFQIQIDLDLVSEKLVKDILTDAGRLVGLGDWRPAKKGQYGRFAITSWEKVK